MQEHYLAKWLSGELTPEELQEFKKSEAYATYVKIAEASSKFKAPDFDSKKALEQLKASRLQKPKQSKVISLARYKTALQIAAAVIVLFAGYWFFTTKNTVVNTELAQQTEISLPDNSVVKLNAQSKLVYNKPNWDKKRTVNLNGEAFFKVAKGKKFDVATDYGVVSVLGTEFNVKSRANYFEVSCYEGLVQVTYNNKTLKLPAGKSFLVVDNTQMQRDIPAYSAPSWLTNESTFKSIPLTYVLNELERQYNITVVRNNINTQRLFTGSFTNKNLSLALQSICNPLHLTYEIADNKVMLYEAR